MGISGLLPLLKSIQINQHLSDFAGQTLAVDAYVWLHRGVYACATDLATGKKTTKYVDYAMHRVRLLRHHKIQPYIVFDGGPLPAKKETERERNQRREENLSRAKALAAQGKHSQAREFYVKCVDVTPQMAYQLIKALRAENVPYVVAPYEADAQMAYLERIGLVDGIITEDSDLLVFGCRKVLFKLDSVSSTIVSIKREDFGSLSANEGGISLFGWTDAQFRAMAILSGCDYLASIPGVGLKTAWSLLRKHRTVDQVIRTLRLEGKKSVPQGYLEAYRLAEKVFLHQRVYCPLDEKLVHLSEIPGQESWDPKMEAYVGSHIEASLARGVARGDVDPVTYLPMVDINPGFVPRVLKGLPLHSNDVNRPCTDKGKGKVKANPEGNILSFFSPNPRSTLSRRNSAPSRGTAVAGKSSGKRTLVDVLDEDLAAKRMKTEGNCTPGTREASRLFFTPGATQRRMSATSSLSGLMSGPSRLRTQPCESDGLAQDAKENVDPRNHLEGHLGESPDPVQQEDGYISPSPSYFRSATPDLSSPVRRPSQDTAYMHETMDEFEADSVSSPTATRLGSQQGYGRGTSSDETRTSVLVRRTPSPIISTEIGGPDLKRILSISDLGDLDDIEGDEWSAPSTQSTSGPITPVEFTSIDGTKADKFDDAKVGKTHAELVANGWWNKWAICKESCTAPSLFFHQIPVLRRLETTLTPDGRQSGHRSRPGFAPPRAGTRDSTRQTLNFLEMKGPKKHAESRWPSKPYRQQPPSVEPGVGPPPREIWAQFRFDDDSRS
ncbi:exodeoxyribonuclease 1 [Phlebopus sp. FC_14]|nr:exodeoxyribonuclease 1 [Phlebopus sp. FC_14]